MLFRTSTSFVAFLLAALFTATGVLAGPSYWKAQTSNPASDSWRNGFAVVFSLDENLCKKKYGDSWPQQCAAPALGESGALETNVEMTPPAAGEWRWTTATTLQFTPKTMLEQGATYQVRLKNLHLSPRIQLTNATLGYKTQPQAASFSKETVWIDPSAKGVYAVSLPLQFIWPVSPENIERRFRIAADKADSGLAFGQPRFIWNESHDSAVVNVPITRLSADNTVASAVISGIAPYHTKNGLRVLAGANRQNDSRASFNVTGSRNLLTIKNVQLATDVDQNLNTRYVVEVQLSLHVKPQDLLSHMKATELPLHSENGAATATNWAQMPQISPADLKKGKELPLTLISADDPSDKIRIAVPATQERFIYFAFRNGLVSTSGLTLPGNLHAVRKAEEISPQAAFLQPGNILTLSGEKKLDLYVRELDSVTWKARRIQTPFFSLLAQTKGFTSVPDDSDNDSADEKIISYSDTTEGSIPVKKQGQGQASFPVIDLAPLLASQNNGRGLLNIEIAGIKNGEQVCSQSRLVLVSDLGLRVKKAADGTYIVFAQNQATGKPAENASISLLGKNGAPVVSAKTNADGMAILPAAKLTGEQTPQVATAELGSDLAWLSLTEASRSLDMSAFDTQGKHCVKDGLIASVFPERGLYMPGETLHFGTIIRRFDWAPLPEGLPLEAVLTNPAGTTVLRKDFKAGPDGLAEISWSTPADTPTGTYRLDICLAGQKKEDSTPILGSAQTKVEEFEPDTLAMKTEFVPGRPKGWIRTGSSTQPVAASVHLSTLYGNAAAGHRVHATFVSNPARLHFSGFEDYTFFDSTPPLSESSDTDIPDVSTEQDGSATLALPTENFRGTFQGSVQIEGFEAAGGKAVSRRIDALFSPLAFVIGYKPLDAANNLEYLSQNSSARLSLIALDNDLKQLKLDGITATLSNRRYVNSLVMDSRGEYHYDATPVDSTISDSKIDIPTQGLTIPLPTEKAGEFLLTLKSGDGTVLASIPYTVAGTGLKSPQDNDDTSSLAKGDLRLKLDKKQYQPGETISMRLSAPYQGTGLITIERENVVAHTWFTAEAGESVQKITIPAGFEGKGYINVSFARGPASDAIYMKPHVYAAASFLCGVTARDMGLKITVPDKVLPGDTLKVKVSAKHQGRVLLFAVDEGILSLTGFATPDPLRDLLTDRGLDVETRQAFDVLMPDHARLKGRIPAFGGGMANPGGRFLNPFKRRSEPPFALWKGILSVSPQETEIAIPIPQYLAGKIRIMAIGSGSEGGQLTAGNAEAFAKVRGTVILRPLLPLAVTPGDSFEGALIVSNTVENSGPDAKVHVSIKANKNINLFGSKTEQDITVAENSEQVIRFRARVNDDLGAASVVFKGKTNGVPESIRTQEISVRPPVHKIRTEQARPLSGTADIPVTRNMYAFSASNTLTVAPAPATAFRTIGEKLDNYPYGCTEQQISRAFPFAATVKNQQLRSLLLRSLGADKAATAADRRIDQAISAIRQSFAEYNGVSLWPNGENNDFVTCYAADFLLTLREQGRNIPEDLAGQIFSCLDSIASREPQDLEAARIQAYACWLLMRNGSVMTQQIEKLQTWLNEYAPEWRKDIAAALLADSCAMLRMENKAKQLMPQTISRDGFSDAGFLSYGAAQALFVSIKNRAPWNSASRAGTEELLDAAFSTDSTTPVLGLSARALAGLGSRSSDTSGVRVTCASYQDGFNGQKPQATAADGVVTLDSPMCTSFHVETAAGNAGWFWHLASDGFDRNQAAARHNGIEVSRRYVNSRGEAVTQVRSGDIVTVEITVRSNSQLNNVVLVDLLPGGLEPILDKAGQPEEAQGLIRWERREDRGIFFLNTSPDPVTYTYKTRAVTSGTFVIPSVSAEAMYKPEINASTGGGSLEVTR